MIESPQPFHALPFRSPSSTTGADSSPEQSQKFPSPLAGRTTDHWMNGMRGTEWRLRVVSLFVIAFALSGAGNAAHAALDHVAKHTAIFTQPPKRVPTQGMPDGPLLGNGDVGVALAGPPEAQVFYIGKNDFWTRHPANAKVINVGRVELNIPALRGASYRQEQDLARAEVRGTFTKGSLTVRMRSWVDANTNLLLTELQCDGPEPVSVVVCAASGGGGGVPAQVADDGRAANVGRELHGGGRWYFDGEIADVIVTNTVLSGKADGSPHRAERFDGKAAWHEMAVSKMGRTISVGAWVKIAGTSKEANYIVSKGEWNQAYSLGLSNGRLRWAINGTFVQTEQPLETGQWLYVAGTFDGRRLCAYVDGRLMASLGSSSEPAKDSFTRQADNLPGQARAVAVTLRVIGAERLEFTLKSGVPLTLATAMVSDLDAKDPSTAAKNLVADLTPARLGALAAQHRGWWSDFWARSFLEIPDQEIERRWYAALYVMGSCSRSGKVAPGLWGNWLTTDQPNWQGDFHLNYNFQAPFYIVYGCNHADLSLPFYQAVVDWMPQAREFAKEHGWKGVHYPVSIGPWGLCSYSPRLDLGQRSDAAYAALNFIWYWQYTQDTAWLKDVGYPFLREVGDFWEDYLKLENGRYVIHNDSIHEGSGNDMNPILSLGLVRTLFKNLLAMSAELSVDADRRAKRQDILEKLSAYPLQERGGKTVFRYSEKGTAWWNDNTLGIQHIFPAGAIGLDSDPKLLDICRSTIAAMSRWHDNNGFSSWYTACARIGYDPQAILTNLRQECDRRSYPNLVLYYGGGGIENVAGFLAVNEMLLQSHEGLLRFFPVWPRAQNARFGSLRAVGAFLVSAELRDGVVGSVKILSEKGRACTVQNPWPGRKVRLHRHGNVAELVSGERFTFKTDGGESIELKSGD
jgi:alpha-L-fucosidase 2